MSISAKWAAARLRGPDVSVEQALEYIRRTEDFLIGNGHTNERAFEAAYRKLAGFSPGRFPGEGEDLQVRWLYQRHFAEAFGHVELHHLKSSWVASSYIGGPHGPVSPSGTVLYAINFGKYPNEDEIEEDLTKIAEAFPWLTFDLSVYGQSEESDEGLPSDTWHLGAGSWQKTKPKTLQVSVPDVMTTFLRDHQNPYREITWTLSQIMGMWGKQIAAARETAESSA